MESYNRATNEAYTLRKRVAELEATLDNYKHSGYERGERD